MMPTTRTLFSFLMLLRGIVLLFLNKDDFLYLEVYFAKVLVILNYM